jgi:hypothetical protein
VNQRARVAAFLREHPAQDVCDACTAAALEISVETVARIADELGHQKLFLRDRWLWPCHLCRRPAIVTRALPRATFGSDQRRPDSAA